MLDIWVLEEGMKVERMPDGRVGTVIDWEATSTLLSCGCCSEKGPDKVELTWDCLEAEELRLFEDK